MRMSVTLVRYFAVPLFSVLLTVPGQVQTARMRTYLIPSSVLFLKLEAQ